MDMDGKNRCHLRNNWSLVMSKMYFFFKTFDKFFKVCNIQTGLLSLHINPIQDVGGQKSPPTSFSPVTSTNVRISAQNVLAFSFNPFATLV